METKEVKETKLCKHCQTEIPKKAKVCPQCRRKQSGAGKIILIVLAVWLFGSCLGSSDNDDLDNSQITMNSEIVETQEAETVTINETLIYDENNVCIYVKGIEKNSYGYKVNIYLENNSDLNLGFNARAYSVNRIMTNNNIYSMDCDVAAGKKANAQIEIEPSFLEKYEIKQIETIDILFWAYDNDKWFKEFDTGQVTVNTNLYDENLDKIVGTNIYDNKGIQVDFLYSSNNKYTYCITNNTGIYIDFDVENISVNDFTSSEINYDLLGTIVLNDCQTVFTIDVDNDFMTSNGITAIEKIEFTLAIRPKEVHGNDWKSEVILLEL